MCCVGGEGRTVLAPGGCHGSVMAQWLQVPSTDYCVRHAHFTEMRIAKQANEVKESPSAQQRKGKYSSEKKHRKMVKP